MRGFAGAISTPQYPHADSRALNCEWQIAVALGNQIRLQFIKIDNLDSADRSGRDYEGYSLYYFLGLCAPFARNYIDVTSSTSPDAHVLKRYCRAEVAPDPIDSDDNYMVVRYAQNGGFLNGGLYGFLAQYRAVCEDITLNASSLFSNLHRQFQKTHGSIQTPGYPLNSESTNCKWTIITPPGSYIKVVFHSFNIVDVTLQRLRVGSNQLQCMSNFLEVITCCLALLYQASFRLIQLKLTTPSEKAKRAQPSKT